MPQETHDYDVGGATVALLKAAATASPAYALHGRIYLSNSGWLLMSVPNALVRGAFDALHEPGAELPPGPSGLNAHVSVMSKEEVERVGADRITERGHYARYMITGLKEVVPSGWQDMSKVWFLEVRSPELEKIRKSYGLPPIPSGDRPFHITLAVRRKHVLFNNDVAKAESGSPSKAAAELIVTEAGEQPHSHLTRSVFLYTPAGPSGVKEAGHSGVPAADCGGCASFCQTTSRCGLYDNLNRSMPAVFDLDPTVSPLGSCTAAQPRSSKSAAVRISLPLPIISQEESHTCGEGVVESVGRYFGDVPDVKAHPRDGTAPDQILEAAREKGYTVLPRHGMAVAELREHIDAGRAVLVPLQAYGTQQAYANSMSGHWVAAIGYDDENVYFQDPAAPARNGKRGYLSVPEFEERWHDQDANGREYHRYGIVLWKEGEPAHTDHSYQAEKISAYDVDEPDWDVYDEAAVKGLTA